MKINGSTELLGIFGNPIKHTLSPDIHNTISEILGRKEIYVPFHVEDDLENAVAGAYAMGVRGLNITVPFKQDVMPFLCDIDEVAKGIGAVNTLVRTENGFKGYNTDMPGLRRALLKSGVSVTGKKVIIIGAGGASRAACYLTQMDKASEVYLVNRNFDKAKSLADDMNQQFGNELIVPVAVDSLDSIPKEKGAYLMFQCTSLGLKAEDKPLIAEESFYDLAAYGYDLIYNPAVTPFLKILNEKKIPNDNGLGMLLYQGIIAYEYWTKESISDETARRVMTVLEKKLYGDNIVLVGYMAAGKTTIGNALAEKTGRILIDTDQMIEKEQGKKISQIFAESGEQAFRDMETELLERLSKNTANAIISTGGGIVLRKENAKLLKKMGKVFYLKCSPEETFKRVKNDTTRPLLSSESEVALREKIETMTEKRMPYYENASDAVISTDAISKEGWEVEPKSLEAVMNEILSVMHM